MKINGAKIVPVSSTNASSTKWKRRHRGLGKTTHQTPEFFQLVYFLKYSLRIWMVYGADSYGNIVRGGKNRVGNFSQKWHLQNWVEKIVKLDFRWVLPTFISIWVILKNIFLLEYLGSVLFQKVGKCIYLVQALQALLIIRCCEAGYFYYYFRLLSQTNIV